MDMTNIRTIAITVIIAASILALAISCSKSADRRNADADYTIDDTQQTGTNEIVRSEWQIFKDEADSMIVANEMAVAAYKAKMTNAAGKLDAKYDRKIDELEKKNADLKIRMQGYKDDGKTDWVKFRNEVRNDLVVLGTALKGFAINNPK